MWFKKLFRGNSVNHFNKCDMATEAITSNVINKNSKSISKSIEADCDIDSMNSCHKQFIRESTSEKKSIQLNDANNITASISSNDKNNKTENRMIVVNNSMVINESIITSTTDKHELQVIIDKKKLEHTISNNTQEIDIETTFHRFSDRPNDHEQQAEIHTTENEISCITNVNNNGNGENDCDSLSKSKDTRLQTAKLNIVSNTNICRSNSSITFDVYCDDKNHLASVSCTNEWPSLKSQQCDFLHCQAKEVELIIAKNKIERNINCSDNINNCCVCDDQALIDWVIISIELKPILTASCEQFLNDNNSQIDESLLSSSAAVQQQYYYTSSEYSDIDSQPIVSLHSCPSIYTLNDEQELEHRIHFANQQDYGISYYPTSKSKLRRLIRFLKIFDCGIRSGIPVSCIIETSSLSSSSTNIKIDKMKFNDSISTLNERNFLSSDSLFTNDCDNIYSDYTSYALQEPCSSDKKVNPFATPMIHSTYTSITTIDSIKSQAKYLSIESIPQYFGLNEYGDIIINIDHICEEKGFGFMMRRKKEIYRKIPYGEEVYEKYGSGIAVACKRIFKTLTSTFWKCNRGEFISIEREFLPKYTFTYISHSIFCVVRKKFVYNVYI